MIFVYCFRERRHAEVEADKKQAEAAHSAVKIKNEDEAAADGAADFHGGGFAPGERRGGTPGATGKAGRLVPGGAGVEAAAAGARARSSRLSDRDKGPPPDPGYK